MSYIEHSNKKAKHDSPVSKQIDEGKKYMKSNSFDKAIKLFQQLLKK